MAGVALSAVSSVDDRLLLRRDRRRLGGDPRQQRLAGGPRSGRAAQAAETRRRIIEATRAALTEGPLRSVSLEQIAERAGVCRSTLHLIFGTRATLLLAVAEDLLGRGDFARLTRAARRRDARHALRRSLALAARLYAQEHAVGMALLSLAAVDGDAAPAATRLNQGRAEGMASLARRFKEQGYLAPQVSEGEAADVLWVITSIETFHQLYVGRQLAPAAACRRLLAMAERTLGIAPLTDGR